MKTDEGKAISSKNATTHGIFARLSTDYDQVQFDNTYEALLEEFGGETPSKRIMVELAAITYVRIHRCARYESELLKEILDPPKYETVMIEEPLFNDDPLTALTGKSEERLVHEGQPATIKEDLFARLDTLHKYEPPLYSRLIKLIIRLSQ